MATNWSKMESSNTSKQAALSTRTTRRLMATCRANSIAQPWPMALGRLAQLSEPLKVYSQTDFGGANNVARPVRVVAIRLQINGNVYHELCCLRWQASQMATSHSIDSLPIFCGAYRLW